MIVWLGERSLSCMGGREARSWNSARRLTYKHFACILVRSGHRLKIFERPHRFQRMQILKDCKRGANMYGISRYELEYTKIKAMA